MMAAESEIIHHAHYAMSLTDQETRWALTIKDRVRDDENLRELSDYEYAQYALVTKGDIESALQRIQGLQHFREEYQIHDTLEEGMELLREFTIQHPWFVLDVEFEPQFGHFVCVYDYGVLDPTRCNYPKEWRIYLGGVYYLSQLLQANLGSIREGLVHICECEGMGWNNFSVEFSRRTWYHFGEFYPIINKEVSWLHTSVVANMMHAQYKSMMGPAADIIRVGCQFEAYDGRLDGVFKMPNEAIAQSRLLARYQNFLTARFHNQQLFALPAIPPPLEEDDELDDDEEEENVFSDEDDDDDDNEDGDDHNEEEDDDGRNDEDDGLGGEDEQHAR